jgi:anthranilate 1,2-dioxygenase small subunit
MDEIQQLVAENEIRNLVARYAHLVDDAQVDEWGELFPEDGRMEAFTIPLEGRAAIVEWINGVLSGPKLRHMIAGTHVVVDSATEAHGTVDTLLLAAVEGSWIVAGAPRYVDRYVKTAEGWRFAERILEDRSAKA